MNKPLLEQVIKHIEEEPKRLNMSTWLISLGENDLVGQRPPCGTIGCIAGWAVHLSGKSSAPDGWESRARRLLDLTGEQAEKLFFCDNWPKPFATNFYNARNKEEESRITVARIIHFMETGE